MQTKKTIILAVLFFSIGVPLYIHWSSEVDTAVSWLYQNGITKYTNATTFKSNSTIRRDEASKLFSVFAKTILQKPNIAISQTCTNFSDLPTNNTMKSYVFDACTRGYILWNNNKFSPFASLSNAQAVAIIIRMIEGKKDESWTPRASEYYKRAQELWLLSGLSLIKTTAPITRGKLGILLYRVSMLPDISTYIQQNNIDIGTAAESDLIINRLIMNQDANGYRYHTFTIKNIWSSSYVFKSSDYASCGYGELTTGIKLNLQGSIAANGTRDFSSSIAQSAILIKKDAYTGGCHLYTNDDNQWNNSFNFWWPDYYDFLNDLPQATQTQLPDLIILGVEMQGTWDDFNTYSFLVTVKNIWLWTAYINQSQTLEPVCPWNWEAVVSKKIISSEAIPVNWTFIVSIPWPAYGVVSCYLYYGGTEMDKPNNYLKFPTIH